MDIKQLQEKLLVFRDDRDWKQFHNPKDLATAISIESWELLEKFLRKTSDEAYKLAQNNEDVADELADIFSYILLFAHEAKIDLIHATEKKIQKNDEKYPIEKAKWSSNKYTTF